MSRIFNFDIQNGKLYLGRPAHVLPLSPLHEKAWNMICDYQFSDDEWLIVFNILGPQIANQVAKLPRDHVKRIIDNYINDVPQDDGQYNYIRALTDDESKLTHIIRERFEVMLKIGRELQSHTPIFENSGLSELKPFFQKIPKYSITAVVEVLTLYRRKKRQG